MAILAEKTIVIDKMAESSHSITFGDKNTWMHWNLVPTSRPVIVPPTVKLRNVEVPGRNGTLDLTDSIMGFPRYRNRKGKLKFYIIHENEPDPYELVRKLGSYLHGKQLKMILEDDPKYFYKGLFWIDSTDPRKDYSTITIGYEVGPFKWSIYTTDDRDWLWDPFNFKTGIVPLNLRGVKVIDSEPTVLNITPEISGVMQETYPLVTVTSTSRSGCNCVVDVGGIRTHTQHLAEGENKLRTNLIGNSTITLTVETGNADVDIYFRKGML